MNFCLEAWYSMGNNLNITTVNYIALFCNSMCKKPMSVQRLSCFFLTRSEIPGAVFARAQRRSSSTSLSLYLDLKTNRLENPVSQRYAVGNGRMHNTVSERTGYDCKHLIQNWHCREINSCCNKFREALLCCLRNIVNFDCEWMGFWQAQIRYQADLENMIKFHLQACASIFFTEIIIIILLSGLMLYPTKKEDRIGNV